MQTMSDEDVGRLLGPLRAELETVDRQILDALRRRLALCERVGELKRAHGVAMMQPARVATVLDRAGRYAEDSGMRPEFLRAVYRSIIDETCRLEDEIIGARS